MVVLLIPSEFPIPTVVVVFLDRQTLRGAAPQVEQRSTGADLGGLSGL